MAISMKSRLRQRKPLGNQIYEALKRAILKGELPPGQRLVEVELAHSFGASRTPVRQAIHMLERDGLTDRPSRGKIVVRYMSIEDIEEILDLRSVLESLAARRATEHIRPESIHILERQNQAFLKAIENNDLDKLAPLNTDFHETLYSLCPNQRLNEIIHDLTDHFYRYRIALLRLQDMARVSYEDHKQMIQAMAAGNPDLAEQLTRAHILKGKEVILKEAREGRFETG
jgi:DNA-binding GntR family transcriptional regulator